MSSEILQNQKRLYLVVMTTVALCIGGLVSALSWKSSQTIDQTNKRSLALPVVSVDPKTVFVERLESDLSLVTKKLESLENALKTQESKQAPQDTQKDELIQHLTQRLTVLEEEMRLKASHPSPASVTKEAPVDPTPVKIIIPLTKGVSGSKRVFPDSTIPAGSFAQGILLGGVDASTAITSASDPRPLLVRVTDKGTLPRRFQSDLNECHVLVSSYGDLSSERVFMRLEKLTCVARGTGEITETQVAGYVSGEDGKAGVRGTLIDRAGESLYGATMSGFFGGFGKLLESYNRMPLTASLLGEGMISGEKRLTDFMKAGVGAGIKSSFEQIADYYIKRAEQIHPIIQVAAGRKVNIVFTQGTHFGEMSVQESLEKTRAANRVSDVTVIEKVGG